MNLEVVIENAAKLAAEDNNAFALTRRIGFGASDSSILLGVNPFKTAEELIMEKCSRTLTADEKRVGDMVNVRKGSDLEPIILKKVLDQFKIDKTKLSKPEAMYRITEYPYLTVNFDSLYHKDSQDVPIELKYISPYGGKYYDFSKATNFITTQFLKGPGAHQSNEDEDYVKYMAAAAGIPIYYYTQVQQQLLASDASHAYLSALYDKDWKLYTFLIFRDVRTIELIINRGYELWNEVLERRKRYGY